MQLTARELITSLHHPVDLLVDEVVFVLVPGDHPLVFPFDSTQVVLCVLQLTVEKY